MTLDISDGERAFLCSFLSGKIGALVIEIGVCDSEVVEADMLAVGMDLILGGEVTISVMTLDFIVWGNDDAPFDAGGLLNRDL